MAGLRAAAEERARQAELDRVRVEGREGGGRGEGGGAAQAAPAGRGGGGAGGGWWLGGLAAVLAVQRRGQRRPGRQERRTGREQAKVQARFELAQKAIATFHTGVSEDILLKNDQFKELRTKFLKEAAGFYADLEKLLAGQTDAKSRQPLAAGYFQLGEC